MAVLKPLRVKDKTYVFKVYGNEKSENPAKAVFSRFPLSDELFPIASQKSIMESSVIKDFDNTTNAKEQLVKHIIDVMVENMTNNRLDFIAFIKECISHFENFQYGSKKIKTVDDFLSLPQSAVETISKDLYFYSKEEEKFEMGE
jgi:hypothetical protein